MLRSLKEIQNYKIFAKDGEIGSVDSFLFDDLSWNTRYVVADIGTWLSNKSVLISPFMIEEADVKDKKLFIKLTKDEIENSPSIDEKLPVSSLKKSERKKEQNIILLPRINQSDEHIPPQTARVSENESDFGLKEKDYGHFRSTKEVIGYKIHAMDGEIGHVEDFIVDSKLTWSIYFLVVDTGGWLSGKKVIVSSKWINRISWDKKEVQVDLIKDKIQNSPPYDPSMPINREYETLLFDYYGKPRYWV